MRAIRDCLSGPSRSAEETSRAPKHPSLVALAALLPGAAKSATAISERVITSLEKSEAIAIQNFELAAQQCLAKLSGSTVLALQQIGKELTWIAQERPRINLSSSWGNIVEPSSPKATTQRTIFEIFEWYDKNHDGTLSRDEFKEAYLRLTSGRSRLTDGDMEQIMLATDVNGDGRVDLHEFVVWLYSVPNSTKSLPSRVKIDVKVDEAKKCTAEDIFDSNALQKRLCEAEAELQVKRLAVDDMERRFGLEIDSCLQFWCSVAKSSGTSTIEKKIDLKMAEWIGNGKYGFVLKSLRRTDNRPVVVKLIGIRWAHLAVSEWQISSYVGTHSNLVEYEEVLLHADDDDKIKNLIRAGFEQGKLSGKGTRDVFPDRFLFFMEEFCNSGSVQDWMSQDMFFPGSMLLVLQGVATALAYMHERNVTHNDVKPENVLLHQDEGGGPRATMHVKLGDLGLASHCQDRTKDFWQYGMTMVCMVTGELFGMRKFRAEASDVFVADVASAVNDAGSRGRLSLSLAAMPGLLRKVFGASISMKDVSLLPDLQGWSFFDGETGQALEDSFQSGARRNWLQEGPLDVDAVSSMKIKNYRRAVSSVSCEGDK